MNPSYWVSYNEGREEYNKSNCYIVPLVVTLICYNMTCGLFVILQRIKVPCRGGLSTVETAGAWSGNMMTLDP